MTCTTALAQSKTETLNWLNHYGESYLGQLTQDYAPGTELNVSENGNVYIETSEEALVIFKEDTQISQKYAFKLSDIDPNKISIYVDDGTLPSTGLKNRLIIRCQIGKDCVDTTIEYEISGKSNLKSKKVSIGIADKFDTEKAERLKSALIHAVKLFEGTSKEIDEDIFDYK